MAKKAQDAAPAVQQADKRKYKVDTLTRATGVVVTGKSQVVKRKPLYPPNLAPIKPHADPLAKQMKQRKAPHEP